MKVLFAQKTTLVSPDPLEKGDGSGNGFPSWTRGHYVVQVRNNLDYTNNLLGFHSGKFTEMYFVSGLRQECQSEQHFGKRLTIIETDKREDN